jgi:transposase, IS30 family
LPIKYKHFSEAEKNQIYALMKTEHDQPQIAKLLNRHKSTTSREFNINTVFRHYRPKQACELSVERAQNSRNAPTIAPWVLQEDCTLLQIKWSPKQIASKLPTSHEMLYQHVYADKAQGGALWKNLRCQKQKRKRYAGGWDRRRLIPRIISPLGDHPLYVQGSRRVGHWGCDTVIGSRHKGAVVTMVELENGYAVVAKITNKTSDLVS